MPGVTPEEAEAFNPDSAEREGTMVMDLRTAEDTYDGKAYNANLEKSATADAEHYFGWTCTGEPITRAGLAVYPARYGQLRDALSGAEETDEAA